MHTPSPSPVYHSAVMMFQGVTHEYATVSDRLAALRGTCLVRDRHRCVIGRDFDSNQAAIRFKRDGPLAQDDDGAPLVQPLSHLEVAHILPHSLMERRSNDTAVRSLTIL